jgi:hypothetical protein
MNNMQLNLKLHNISELKAILSDINSTNDTLVDIYQKFSTKRIKTFFDTVKDKGIDCSDILFSLILTRLLDVTIRALLISGQNPKNLMGKDTLYRLKNNSSINWRTLLYIFVIRNIKLVKQHTKEKNEGIKCLILDDSFLKKTGKRIEFIGRVFDHVCKRSLLGIKMLTLGYWDGKSFNPLDFSFHRELGKNPDQPYGMTKKELKERFSKKRDEKSAGKKRVKELDINKIKNGLSMIKRAIKHGITANYVLLDSWFVCDFMIKEIPKIKNGMLHLLGMCKKGKSKYLYENKELTAKELLKKTIDTKQNKRCRKFKSHYINLVVDFKGVKVQLFFTKYVGQKDWNMLLTTDLKLSYTKAIEIYQIRWSIEVFFKESKQYLQLGKSQSADFDGQIADTTISMIVYVLLNLRKRFSDYETLGEIFRDEGHLIKELNLWEKLWGLFQELLQEIIELLEIDIDKIMEKIVTEKPGQKKILLLLEKLNEERWSQNVA